MTRLIYIFACIALCCAQSSFISPHDVLEFTTFNGKRSDPCHIGLSAPTNPDCTTSLPDASVTVLAPSTTSNGGANPGVATLLAGTGQAVIRGHDIQPSTAALVGQPNNLWIALSSTAGKCATIDANLATVATADSTGMTLTFTVPVSWLDPTLELEANPRSLCLSQSQLTGNAAGTLLGVAGVDPLLGGVTNTFFYIGFKWKVVWACNKDIVQQNCPPPISNTDPKAIANGAAYNNYPMNPTMQAIRTAMTTCCVNTVGSGSSWSVNQCINPNVDSCCGSAKVHTGTELCCSTTSENVVFPNNPCPCFTSTASDDCKQIGQVCCLKTKYSELTVTKTTNLALNNDARGQCYNTTIHECCDTGLRFDPGSSQCCVVNGIQSLDLPCPCAVDTDCVGDFANTQDDSDFMCCRQTTPPPYETAFEARAAITGSPSVPTRICNKYANYPSGTGLASLQPCLGTCINKRYQICCNGATCVKNYDYCCNATCCNKYVGTCAHGRRAPAGQPNAFNNFGDFFDVCSTVEQMNTIRAFWIFVLPTELLFATFVCLAICLAFAARAKDTHEFSITERLMVVIAVLTILFAITLFFAPLWKYGFVTITVSLFVILTASARVRFLNVVCVFFLVVALFYMYDFVDGNFYLGLPSNRTVAGTADPATMGVLHATARMYKSVSDVINFRLCVNYYKYFLFDMNIRDYERFDNPFVTTFGYCSRAWVVALYLFEGAILGFLVLQLILSILALIIRFRKTTYDALLLEVQGKQPY